MDASPPPRLSPRPLPFHTGRPLVSAALTLSGGVLLGALRPFHWLWLAGLAAACLLALFWFLSGRKTVLGVLPAFFFLGLMLASLSANPVRPAEGDYAFMGTVSGQVRFREDGQVACVLKNVSIGGESLPGGAYWTFYLKDGEPPPALDNGCGVSFSGRLYPPQGQMNPYGFDFDLYLKQRNISVCLYGREGLAITAPRSVFDGDYAYRLRESLTRALAKTMGDKAGLAAVMLLGAADQLPEEDRQDFRITGTAHVLSVSGLHVGYLAFMILWLLKEMKVRPKARFAVTAAFLIAYAFLTGGNAPVIRASLMLLVYLGAKLYGRAHDPMTSIAAAYLLLLILRPLDLLSPGFQLSFGAVTAMLVLGQPLLAWQSRRFPGKKLRHPGRPRRFIHQRWQALKALPAMGIAAQLGVVLPLAVWYHQVSLLGIFVNLLVIPYVAVLMAAFLLALAASPFGVIGQAAGAAAGWLAGVLQSVVHFGAGVPGMALQVPSPSFPVAIGCVVAMLLLSPYVLLRGRRRALALVTAAVFAVGLSQLAVIREVRYIQLSVGDADAAILTDGGYTAVIDVGETGAEVADMLLAEGRDIDALVLTHLHMDHAGGVERLLQEGIMIRHAYLPEGAESTQADAEAVRQLSLLREAGVPVETLAAGAVLESPRTSMTVVWPMAGKVRPHQDANQTPLVLWLQMEEVSLLQASDITGMFERYAAIPADILKVSHHGSVSSTGDGFLDAVGPQMAVISCSGLSSLPAAGTLKRIQSHGIPLLRTDEAGAVTLLARGDTWRVIPFVKGAAP